MDVEAENTERTGARRSGELENIDFGFLRNSREFPRTARPSVPSGQTMENGARSLHREAIAVPATAPAKPPPPEARRRRTGVSFESPPRFCRSKFWRAVSPAGATSTRKRQRDRAQFSRLMRKDLTRR